MGRGNGMRKWIAAVAMFIAAAMLAAALAACGGSGQGTVGDSGTPITTATEVAAATTAVATTATEAAAADGSASGGSDGAAADVGGKPDPYSFTYYFYWEWYTLHPWGVDETSKKWKDQFNIDIEFSKPDADPEAKLNLMISSNDLPDVVMMDRGPVNKRMVELGMLTDLAPLQANNPTYDENVLKQSQEIMKIDGVLYALPCWPRKAASGGNDCWIYDRRIYESAGSPVLKTFEDLYEYAKLVKEKVPVNNENLPVIPFSVDGQETLHFMTKGFYRSFGGFNGEIYGRVGDELKLTLRDPKYRDAIMEANRWYREGLIADTNFTDSKEQILEKLVAGRAGLLYYNMDQDDYNHFRSLLVDSFPDDDYIVLDAPAYPPARGLAPDKIYADSQQTVGDGIVCITKKAEQPQRIFDFLSYLYTKDASIEMMYGPKGFIWDELDANGNPILTKYEADMTAEEQDDLGMWFWTIPSHSDNVDMTNFAVNAMLPREKQNWVVWVGANIITPLMFVSDEYNGLNEVLDPNSDEGIKKTLCENQRLNMLPRVIMAKTPEEAEKLYDDLLAFCDDNGMADVERLLNEKYKENVAMQGYTAYTR